MSDERPEPVMGPPATRSYGLLVSPFAEHFAIYDLRSNRVHIVNQLAGILLQSLADNRSGSSNVYDEIARDLSAATGSPFTDARRRIDELSLELEDAGILTRTSDDASGTSVVDVPGIPPSPPRATTVGGDGVIGPTYALVDHRVAFRSSDSNLLDEVDELLGLEHSNDRPSILFDIEPTKRGGILLVTDTEWDFPTRNGFIVQLPGAINDFVGRSSAPLILHAGAARTTNGDVIVVPGQPEAGKSTLTAALVTAGCDYLGDELVGVRPGLSAIVGLPQPFVLDDNSLEVLGQDPNLVRSRHGRPHVPAEAIRLGTRSCSGDCGPPTRVVLTRFDPSVSGDPVEILLDPIGALREILPTVMNLRIGGENCWTTLCELVTEVPVSRIIHSDATHAARWLIQTTPVAI